jgi:hypothetical protein
MALVAWYLFNDPNTFLVDNSGNGNTLTDVNGVDSFNDPTYGTVASFSNNPTNYFSLATAPASTLGASPRTFSYWLYLSGSQTYRIIHGQGTSPELRVQFSNRKYDINGGSGANSTTSPTDTWIYVTLTYDGSIERTYFDGVLNKTASRSYNTSAGSLFIGSATNFTNGYSLTGYITDFRIYDGALSDSDVSTLYSNGPGPDEPLKVDALDVSASVTIAAVDGATGYKLTLQETGSSTVTTVDENFTELEKTVTGLTEVTEYTLTLYSTTNTVYELVDSVTFTTSEPIVTVTWVLDGSGRYEVSTKEHLHQIMNIGAIHVDAGTPPPDYRLASYIQTADIDLLGLSTYIKVIESGQNESGVYRHFQGTYDGALFKISNWVHNDSSVVNASLFGSVYGGHLKNIRMAGVWTIAGSTSMAAFLVSALGAGGTVYNCEGNFDEGTAINAGGSVSCAGLIGNAASGTFVENVSLYGSVYVEQSTGYCGGIFAQCFATMKGIRNMADFPNGLEGWSCAGIAGRCQPNAMSMVINGMSGNIHGTSYSGGIAGFGNAPANVDTVVNCMTGNITSGAYCGGIWALFNGLSGVSYTKFFNYMSGDISSTNASLGGGMFGRFEANGTFTESINAMNGSCKDALIGALGATQPTSLEITVDTSFGLIAQTDNHGTATPPATLTTNPVFTELPYEPIVFTDGLGNNLEWGFMFANLGGNPTYSSLYTHLTLHTRDLEVPFYAVTGIPDTNTTVYLTYAKLSEKFLYMDSSLTVTDTNALYIYDHIGNLVYTNPSELTITLTPRSINVFVVIKPVEDAVGYKLTYQENGGTELIFESRFTELTKNITPLLPETTYQVGLYADYGSGAGFVLVEFSSTTTLANIAENYDTSDFADESGTFDFSDMADASVDTLSEVLNSLFTTGDDFKVSLEDSTVVEANFVNIGGTVDITDEDTLLIPFDESSGSGQSVTLTLSDSSSEVVSYDETLETITVSGQTYAIGSTFIIDGKKVTISKW